MSDDWASRSRAFRHEAFLYSARDEFIEGVTDFIVDGLVRGEPAVVAVTGEKIEALRSALGGGQEGVFFTDMDQVGRNPARLIPAYHDFIGKNAPAGPSRGVGEPVGPHRRGAELVECEIHESLCNLAFTMTGWWVLCPYDTTTLDPVVVDEACRNHPYLLENGTHRESRAYRDVASVRRPLGDPLPALPEEAPSLAFTADRLYDVRRFIARHASAAGLDPDRMGDLVLAIDKIVTNSLRRAEGEGVLSLWQEGPMVFAEVRDRRRITDPLVGREPPGADVRAGQAFRTVNQLCDLLQVRSGRSGTTVRVHMALGG